MDTVNGDGLKRFNLGTFMIEMVVAGAVGTGLWLFGERLISRGHDVIGGCVTFLALIVFFATVPIALMNFIKSRGKIWGIFLLICAIFGLCFFSGSGKPTQPPTVIVTNAIPPEGVKQQIRALMNDINPKILDMVDAGQKDIPVMICNYHGGKIQSWAESDDGRHYFTIKTTTLMIMGGSHNQMFNYLNDVDEDGTLNGYVISPKEALRSSPQ